MSILEFNPGTANLLPGPVDKIICQSGQVIVVDNTTKPATTTTLNTDDVFDAEGKAGLNVIDVDGSRIYVEQSNAPIGNRTDSQLVTSPDVQPEVDPREPKKKPARKKPARKSKKG